MRFISQTDTVFPLASCLILGNSLILQNFHFYLTAETKLLHTVLWWINAKTSHPTLSTYSDPVTLYSPSLSFIFITALWDRSYSNPHLIQEYTVKMPITVSGSVNRSGDDCNNSSSQVAFVTTVIVQPHVPLLTESI